MSGNARGLIAGVGIVALAGLGIAVPPVAPKAQVSAACHGQYELRLAIVAGDSYLELPADVLDCAEAEARDMRLAEALWDRAAREIAR
jgi:hypothetical protein